MPQLPLKHRAVLAVSGGDRQSFLQGMLSNDMALVTNNALLYACFLSPQGKFLTDIFLQAKDNDVWLLDVEADYAGALMQQLNMFKLRADVQIAPTDLAVWAGWDSSQHHSTHPRFYNGVSVCSDPRLNALGWRAMLPKDVMPQGEQVSLENYDAHRISLGVPCGARDLKRGLTALLEAGLDKFKAISFTKGCYVGQELTARMHYKALAKKALLPVYYNGPALLRGADVRNAQGHLVGEVASAVDGLALAYIKLDALGDELSVGGIVLSLLPD